MGFKKGNVSFSRFKVEGGPSALSADDFDKMIKARAFRDFFPEEETEIMGWTSIDNVLDTEFAYTFNTDDRYRFFALRIDRRMIPASIVKMRVMEEEARILKENGQRRLYKEERKAIYEGVRRDLEKSIPPVPRIYEVAWSVEKRTVYFGSLSYLVCVNFASLFRETFGLSLITANPVKYIEPGKQLMNPPTMSEFLTWLWFKAEKGTTSPTDLQVSIVRRVILESGAGEYVENVICQGRHAELREGKEALRQGKKVVEARISLCRDACEFEFTLRANGFQFQTVKLPAPEVETEEGELGIEGQLLERIFLIEKAVDSMELLEAMFMERRWSDEWPDEVKEMERWANDERS